MDPVIVAGLGNPGPAYETTRHNVGFRVVDEVARRHGVRWFPCAGPGAESRCLVRDRPIILLKPLTYMNGSGTAVAAALDRHFVSVDRLLVVLDDVALPFGKLRMRPGGSDGGHNGLGSVILELETDVIPRLRCGIGGPEPVPGEDLAEYVLSPFTHEEEQAVRPMIARAADMIEEFAVSGIETAMSVCNAK